MPLPDAIATINAHAALAPTIPELIWDTAPSAHLRPPSGVRPDEAVLAELARAAIDLLTGPSLR